MSKGEPFVIVGTLLLVAFAAGMWYGRHITSGEPELQVTRRHFDVSLEDQYLERIQTEGPVHRFACDEAMPWEWQVRCVCR